MAMRKSRTKIVLKIKNVIKDGLVLLKNPEQGFKELAKKSLEKVVGDYLTILLLLSIAAAALNIIISLLRAIYFNIFRKLEVDYMVLLNYTFTESFALVFSYVLVGTFILFIVSIVAKIFCKKLKYTEFLKITLYSAYPILLFCWVPIFLISLLAWSIFLFFIGLHLHKAGEIKSTSIRQRD